MPSRALTRFATAGGLVVAVLVSSSGLWAQEGDGYEWENTTELSYVSTGGNASSSTLGLKSTLTAEGGANAFKLEVSGIRGETTFRTITATGTPSDFTIVETENSELTAESYSAKARYDRTLGAVFAFAGAGWDRNTFAGVQNRYALVVGAGKTWTDSEAGRLKTDLGATYTIQKDVDPAPGADEGFAGARLTVDARRVLSPAVTLTSALTMDENLEDAEDLRADWTNAVSVSLAEGLAFKTSLQLQFDNQPSLLSVPLLGPGGAPTGTEVLTPGEKLDRVVTLTLVLTL